MPWPSSSPQKIVATASREDGTEHRRRRLRDEVIEDSDLVPFAIEASHAGQLLLSCDELRHFLTVCGSSIFRAMA